MKILPQVDPVPALRLAVLPPLLGPDRLLLGDALPLGPRVLGVLDSAGHVARLGPQRQPRLPVGNVARWQNLIPSFPPSSTLAQSKERKGYNFAA